MAKGRVARALAEAMGAAKLDATYRHARIDPTSAYKFESEDVGRRALALALLGHLKSLGTPDAHATLFAHYQESTNFTDKVRVGRAEDAVAIVGVSMAWPEPEPEPEAEATF